jgi:hypothetical protein
MKTQSCQVDFDLRTWTKQCFDSLKRLHPESTASRKLKLISRFSILLTSRLESKGGNLPLQLHKNMSGTI